MNSQTMDRIAFLSLRHLPARLRPQEAAWLLGCHQDEIAPLIEAKLLKPLGKAPRFAIKYFSTRALLQRMENDAWLAKVTDALIGYWRQRNAQKPKNEVEP